MILTLGRDWELLEQFLDPTLRYIIILLLMWPRQSTELLALASSLYSPLMKWNVVSIWGSDIILHKSTLAQVVER